MNNQNVLDRGEHRHRREIGLLVAELRKESRIHHDIAGGHDHQRVAIGRRLGRGLDAEVSGRAGPVLHDHRLRPGLGELLPHRAGEQVHWPTWRKRRDPADWFDWICLTSGEAADANQH
jgi:hypothetical protein